MCGERTGSEHPAIILAARCGGAGSRVPQDLGWIQAAARWAGMRQASDATAISAAGTPTMVGDPSRSRRTARVASAGS